MNDHRRTVQVTTRSGRIDGSRVVIILGWLVGGISASLVGTGGSVSAVEQAMLLFSLLSLAFGIWLFLAHGERRITAAGVWGFAFALFVGFAGLYTLFVSQRIPPGLLAALTVAYFGQVFMYGLFWRERPRLSAAMRWPADPGVARWGIIVGSLLLLGSSLMAGGEQETATLVDAAAFTSVVVLTASLLLHGGNVLGVWRLVLIASAFFAYSSFVFSGFGRLTLGALGLSLAILACKWFRGRKVKVAILLVTGPTLLILAQARVAFTAGLNPDQGSITGLESLASPLTSIARLLSKHAQLPRAWGSTFWASAVAFVPRGLWPAKPAGFGAELVPILSPELVGTGHSEAALSHGEWLYNFGLIGLVLMILVLGWIVRWIDRWLETVNSYPLGDRRRLLSFVAATIAAAGMADLVWAGTFTWVARSGSRLLIVGLLFLVSGIGLVTRSRSSRAPAPASDTRGRPANRTGL
ncbi:MAG: hypothetical protein M3N43_02765 [Actinomycetota bacterium]|nr:hypothetical protein [Actinomycetota bacterium]